MTAVTWWVSGTGTGNISSSGLYTAPASGTPGVTITATSGGVSGNASVTLTDPPPTVATAASASPGTVTGNTTSLSVLGADAGGAANLTYTWTPPAGPPPR